jgi:hypothetical protein
VILYVPKFIHLFLGLLDSEDGGTILRNLGHHSPREDAESHPRRPDCSKVVYFSPQFLPPYVISGPQNVGRVLVPHYID